MTTTNQNGEIKTYGNPPKSLLKACEKYADKIDEVGNEGDDGYWIYCRAGFINAPMEVHCIHEHTVQDCIRQLKDIVPCTIENCAEVRQQHLLNKDKLT